MSTPKPRLIARVFCSKQVTLDQVIARVREYYATLELGVDVAGEVATFSRPGLTIRIERIDKLRRFLSEANALVWESAQKRAKQRSCVLRVEIAVAPTYEGRMLTTGRADIPDVPDDAVGLVEFLGVTPGADFDAFDQVTNRWLREVP